MVKQQDQSNGGSCAVESGRGESSRKQRWVRDLLLLSIVVLVALVIRGVYIAQQQSDPLFDRPLVDAQFWDAWASAFAAGERFEDGPYYRAPLYAWTLGVVYKTLGSGPVAWRAVQALLGALTCGLVYLIGRVAFSQLVGFLAGLVTASYWILVYFTGEMLIPTLGIFLNTLLVLLLLQADRRRTVLWWASAGIVLGLSAIARPNILLFAPAIVLWMLVSRRSWPQFFTHAAVVTVGCLLVVLPVTIRNGVVGGDRVLISSQAGVNLYIGNNPRADGIKVTLPDTRKRANQATLDQQALAENEAGRKLKPSEISRFYLGKTWDFVRSEPRRASQLLVMKSFLFWSWYEFANNKDIYAYTQRYTPIVAILPLGFGLLGPLGLVGIAVIWPRRRELFPVWGFVLLYMVSVVLFFVSARFRVPILPVLILLAVVAAEWIVLTLKKKDWHSIIRAGIALVILLCVSNIGKWKVQKNMLDFSIAHTMNQDGKFEESLQIYRRLIEEDPENYHAYTDSSLVYLALGELSDAETNARHAVKIDTNHFKGHWVLGVALARQERLDEALPHLAKAVQLMPVSPENQRELGHALLLKGDLVQARRHLERAFELAPNHPDVLASLGILAARENKVTEAEAYFQNSVAINPENPEIYLPWARMSESNGRIADAISVARQGLKHVPQHDQLAIYLAQLLLSPDPTIRNPAEAVRLAEAVCVREKRTNPQSLQTLAKAYALNGRCPEGIDTANDAIRLARSAGLDSVVRQMRSLILRCESGQTVDANQEPNEP